MDEVEDHGPQPTAPNPAEDAALIPTITSPRRDAPSPPADEEDWKVEDMQPETAMKIMHRAMLALANAAGDVPPTPPISRPHTPTNKDKENMKETKDKMDVRSNHRRTPSRPATPVPTNDIQAPGFQNVDINSPEAHEKEPSVPDKSADAPAIEVQRQLMARKFFSKAVPGVSLEAYLNRIQHYCPLSAIVWLAASSYIHTMCLVEKVVPITPKTVHRLVLGSIRVAQKALEDVRYSADRFSKVTGVSAVSLALLEKTVMNLLDWNLQIMSDDQLKAKVGNFQKAAQAATLCSKLPDSFSALRLPTARQAKPASV